MSKGPLRILVVDDSRMMRRAISGIFAGCSEIEIAGQAAGGREALALIPQLAPDVVTLDVTMPDMDGLTTLKHMMISTPKPTVMLSSLTQEGATVSFDALRLGAVDFFAKPSSLGGASLAQQAQELIDKIHLAAAVEMKTIQYIRKPLPSLSNKIQQGAEFYQHVVVMGAAEGGYGALLKIIPYLDPCLSAAYLVVLHAALPHVDAFASYLDQHSALTIKRSVHGEVMRMGTCYLCAGSEYVTLDPQGLGHVLQVRPAPFPNRRGSIDMLLYSVADRMPQEATGIVLSGLGEDGSEGLEELGRVGGTTWVQDPNSCLCKEMPQSSLEQGAIDRLLPDREIATTLIQKLTAGEQQNNNTPGSTPPSCAKTF